MSRPGDGTGACKPSKGSGDNSKGFEEIFLVYYTVYIKNPSAIMWWIDTMEANGSRDHSEAISTELP